MKRLCVGLARTYRQFEVNSGVWTVDFSPLYGCEAEGIGEEKKLGG
jgi:hypothetical protein